MPATRPAVLLKTRRSLVQIQPPRPKAQARVVVRPGLSLFSTGSYVGLYVGYVAGFVFAVPSSHDERRFSGRGMAAGSLGRVAVFGAANLGSNPSAPATHFCRSDAILRLACFVLSAQFLLTCQQKAIFSRAKSQEITSTSASAPATHRSARAPAAVPTRRPPLRRPQDVTFRNPAPRGTSREGAGRRAPRQRPGSVGKGDRARYASATAHGGERRSRTT